MPTLTIIKDDKWVSVDGYGCTLDSVSLAANVHAIQWDGSAGWIEYNDGTVNETIDSISEYSTITNDHASKKTAEETAETELADEIAALGATYGFKRQAEYPSIGDQLDSLYHAGTFDATMTATIKAVKDKYPK